MRKWFSAALLLIGLTACQQPIQSPLRVNHPLVNTGWVLITKNGQQLPAYLHKAPSLLIEKVGFGGFGGCNGFGYLAGGTVPWQPPYDFSDSNFVVRDMVQTAMGCGGDINRYEAEYMQALRDTRQYRLEQDKLILMTPDNTVLLIFRRDDALLPK